MKRLIISSIATSCLLVAFTVPASGGWNPDKVKKDRNAAREIIVEFKAKDSGIKKFFDEAHGYAVFPKITKGGLLIGAAHGSGVVYEKGVAVGSATLSQGTVGSVASWGATVVALPRATAQAWSQETTRSAASWA